MTKHFIRIAAAFLGFAALGIAAKAQVADQAIVKVPYSFVVAGTTLPAGTYRLTRSTDFNNRQLLLSSIEERSAVFVLPIEIDNARGDNKAHFTFELAGGEHFLTKIETADHVFVLPVSREAILQAQMKSHQGSASSGVSGTD